MSEPAIKPWLPVETEHPIPWQSLREALYHLPKIMDQLQADSLALEPEHSLVQGNPLAEVTVAYQNLGYHIEDRKNPTDIVKGLLQAIDNSFKPLEVPRSHSKHDQQWNAYFRETRRCRTALNQYRCLRRLNQYIETVLPLANKADAGTYFEQFKTALEVAAQRLITESAGITNPEAFRRIESIGKPIDRSGEGPIQPDQLVYVRALTDHVPQVQNDTFITTSPFQAGVSNRNSVHGSLNHLVEPHAQGSWQDAGGITLVPFEGLDKQLTPTNLNEVDTYFYGEVALTWPEGAVIIMQQGNPQWEELFKTHPTLEQHYTVLRVATAEAMRTATHLAIERQGYSIIPGGDHQSDDPMIAEKMQAFRKTMPALEGGRSHFRSVADRIDMAHGAILLERAKQATGHQRDWLEAVDWANNSTAHSQLIELVNGASSFIPNVGSEEFTRYNLPEERRTQLVHALCTVLEGAPDPRTPRQAMEATMEASRTDDVAYQRSLAQQHLWKINQAIHSSYYSLRQDASAEAQACLRRLEPLWDEAMRKSLESWTSTDQTELLLSKF